MLYDLKNKKDSHCCFSIIHFEWCHKSNDFLTHTRYSCNTHSHPMLGSLMVYVSPLQKGPMVGLMEILWIMTKPFARFRTTPPPLFFFVTCIYLLGARINTHESIRPCCRSEQGMHETHLEWKKSHPTECVTQFSRFMGPSYRSLEQGSRKRTIIEARGSSQIVFLLLCSSDLIKHQQRGRSWVGSLLRVRIPALPVCITLVSWASGSSTWVTKRTLKNF